MSIKFGSINTGLPKDIVEQMIAAEKIPLQKLEAKKAKIQEKVGLVKELTTHLNDLKKKVMDNNSLQTFTEIKVNTDEDIVAVTADKQKAKIGEYRFEVVRLAQTSSALTSAFPDSSKSYVGVGFLEFFLPDGDSYSLFIKPKDATLDGVARLINEDSKNGLRATVVNDGSGSDKAFRVLISLEDSGDENLVEFPYFYLVDGEEDLFIEKEREAHDAIIKLDGFALETPRNTIVDLIPGLTIDLNRAEKGKEFSILVANDLNTSVDKIVSLVESMNAILKFINVQNRMDENTDSSRTLGGDVVLQTIESRLRNAIFTPIKTTYGNKRISDLGITFQKNGLLSLNINKVENKLKRNHDEVSQILFGKDKIAGGFLDHLSSFVREVLKYPSGALVLKQNGLKLNIDQLNQGLENRERLIEQKERNLRNRFGRLEREISKIKGQGAGIGALSSSRSNQMGTL